MHKKWHLHVLCKYHECAGKKEYEKCKYGETYPTTYRQPTRPICHLFRFTSQTTYVVEPVGVNLICAINKE